MTHVLVTGGNGVIGSWVCRELLHRGAQVTVLDRQERPAVPFAETAGLQTVVGDLRDEDTLRAAIDPIPQAVLHLAAVIGEAAEAHAELAIEVNAVATARLLRLVRERGNVRLVAMSTKGVLGRLDPRHLHPRYEPVPEDAPVNPRSMYDTTKAVVEALIRADRDRGGSSAVVRLATTWGPGKTVESHAGFSVHTDVVTRALRGLSSRLDLHPAQAHDLVYYGDVARGLTDLLLAGAELAAPVYHLGSGRLVTAAAFAAAVQDAFPGVRVSLGEHVVAGRNCLLAIAAAQRDAGYRARYTVEAALEEMRELKTG